MKADYKNWMPKGMVASFTGGAAGAGNTLLLTGRSVKAMRGLKA